MAQVEVTIKKPKIVVHEAGETENDEFSFVENPDVPEALMGFADQVRGNAGARISMSTEFSMKDYGNGAGVSVTVSMDCNQDDATIKQAADGISQWSIWFAEQHYKSAAAKYQQMTQGG